MAYGKGAVAKLASGKTAFVFGGVPGETVDVEVVEDFERYCTAKIVSREVKAEAIPGANWADLPYVAQLLQKKKIVRDALVRNGKFDEELAGTVLKDVVPCENPWNYRNKIELAYANGTLGMVVGGTVLSLQERQRGTVLDPQERQRGTVLVVPVKTFPLAAKAIENSPKALAGALKFALHGEDCGLFRVGVRHSERTGETQVALWTTPGWFPRHEVASIISDSINATSIVRIIADSGKMRKIKQVEVLHGCHDWTEVLHGCHACSKAADGCHECSETQSSFKYSISAPSFFQVNTPQAEVLQELVLSSLFPNPYSLIPKVADLYCGAGTFTLPLSKAGFNVTGVELAGSSTKDLKANLKTNHLQASIICDEVERALPKLGEFDTCVLDPPKCGLNKGVIKALLAKKPTHMVYVSCDPMTLARDLQKLCNAGYSLASVTPVDMFPQTHHIETVCLLTIQ